MGRVTALEHLFDIVSVFSPFFEAANEIRLGKDGIHPLILLAQHLLILFVFIEWTCGAGLKDLQAVPPTPSSRGTIPRRWWDLTLGFYA